MRSDAPSGSFRSPAPPPAGERRLVTVLFADVSGFTAMSERLDHEEVNQVMRACWAELDRVVLEYGGVVDKHIGDALMATFGASGAHEDDPLRAVQVGLALQRRLADFSARLQAATGLALRMRCGVAAGEVTVDRVADSTRELSVIGPAVNLASRLEHECAVGSVFVNGDVYRATEWAIEYRALEPRSIKGIEGPVPLYEALREHEADRRRPGRSLAAPGAIVGRWAEQTALRQALEDLRPGRGRVVALVGEAGLGKSTLAAWLRTEAEAVGRRWVAGRCLSYSATQPYSLAREALRDLLGVRSRMHPGEVLARLREALDDGSPGPHGSRAAGEAALGVDDRLGLLVRLLPAEDGSSALERARAFVEALDPKPRHRLTVQAARDLFVSAARRWPLVLSLEDLHWCDPESLEVVGAVAGAVAHEPLLLLLQMRPGAEPEWLGLPHARVLSLQPLGPDDSASLVESLLGADGGTGEQGEVASRLHEATRGNPYFLVELVRGLAEQGQLARSGGRWELARDARQLPSTVRLLLQARIDGLEPPPRLVLQEASVVGDAFDAPTVEAIGAQPPVVRPSLRVLAERDLVQAADAPADYRFRHGLLRETAYQTLSRRRREEYHARVGALLERQLDVAVDAGAAELLAHHFTNSDRADRAVHYALLAAERAAAQYANQTALFWYDRAAEALDRRGRGTLPAVAPAPVEGPVDSRAVAEARVRLLEGRSAVEALLGQYQAAHEHLEAALALGEASPHPTVVPELCRRLARVHEMQGEYEEALRWVDRGLSAAGTVWEPGDRALAAAPPDMDSAAVARLCLMAGLVLWRCGRQVDATLWGRRALDLAEAAAPAADRDLAQTYNLLGILARHEGRPEESEAFCRASLARYETVGDIAGADKAHTNLACALQDQGKLATALDHLRRSGELARRIGDPVRQAAAQSNMGEIYIHQGELEEARGCYEAALPVLDRVGHAYYGATCRMNLAWLYVGLGDGERALAWASAAQEAFIGLGAAHHLPEVLRHRARALLLLHRPGEALAAVEEALARARELGRRVEEGQALRVLGQVRIALGDGPQAGRLLEASRALLEETGAHYELGLTLLELARLLAGLELCDRAADLFRTAGSPRDLAAAEDLRRTLAGA